MSADNYFQRYLKITIENGRGGILRLFSPYSGVAGKTKHSQTGRFKGYILFDSFQFRDIAISHSIYRAAGAAPAGAFLEGGYSVTTSNTPKLLWGSAPPHKPSTLSGSPLRGFF